jgi:hypothetical protein
MTGFWDSCFTEVGVGEVSRDSVFDLPPILDLIIFRGLSSGVGDFFLEILECMDFRSLLWDFIREGESSESSISCSGVSGVNRASVDIFPPIRDFNFPFVGTGGSSSVSEVICFWDLLCVFVFVRVSIFNSASESW